VREHAIKRPRDPGEIKGAREQARVLALAPRPGPHEPVQLPLGTLPLLRGLPLEDAERADLALSLDDLLDPAGAEGAAAAPARGS
jgi:hypothetical protein